MAVELLLHEAISGFLSAYYQAKPTAIQTLTYKFGSQQGAHSDLHLVSPPTVGLCYQRESLTAAWVACEDANEDNGALVIYPGSHRFLKKPYSHFVGNYGGWVRYLDEMCKERGAYPKPFEAEKGDVLIWHGDLVHGGGKIKSPGQTRKSFVVHYCRQPENVASSAEGIYKHEHKNGWYFNRVPV